MKLVQLNLLKQKLELPLLNLLTTVKSKILKIF